MHLINWSKYLNLFGLLNLTLTYKLCKQVYNLQTWCLHTKLGSESKKQSLTHQHVMEQYCQDTLNKINPLQPSKFWWFPPCGKITVAPSAVELLHMVDDPTQNSSNPPLESSFGWNGWFGALSNSRIHGLKLMKRSTSIWHDDCKLKWNIWLKTRYRRQ